MLTELLQRIGRQRLWDFPGGIHPPENKSQSNTESIDSNLPLAKEYYVPVKQHKGAAGKILVCEGDQVLRGQVLTDPQSNFALPVHAPTSGTVVRIAKHTSAHPSGLPEKTIVIAADNEHKSTKMSVLEDYLTLPAQTLVQRIFEAGISGLGGAGFPTHIKIGHPEKAEVLIINGVECEPYITADDRLMQEHALEVIEGVKILQHILATEVTIIAIEDNKPEAIKAIGSLVNKIDSIELRVIPTKYPSGGEKQLIQILTGLEIPKGRFPIDEGIVMQNVGTCYAIFKAVCHGDPLVERVVTVTGENLTSAKNVWVPIGTPVQHLVEYCGYNQVNGKKLVMGGPMMGFELLNGQVPVVKITNCIIAPLDDELIDGSNAQPCIRCGACADACPVQLLPQQLHWYSQSQELDKLQQHHLFDCIECGACAYVCPSEIPLVHQYRIAKANIIEQQKDSAKSDKAKERFELRQARLQRDKEEREAKHKQAAEERKKSMAAKGNDAKAKIAAAVARQKAKQAQESEPGQTEQAPTEATSKKDQVAAAIARAKAKKAAKEKTDTQVAPEEVATSEVDDRKAKVAAAIARAKAKKQQKKEADDE